MRNWVHLILIGTCLLGAGCSGDKGKELLDTAQFEEKQHNLEHAQKLYAEILAKYPDSAAAKQAKERLGTIGK